MELAWNRKSTAEDIPALLAGALRILPQSGLMSILGTDVGSFFAKWFQ
jgi:hypothetical protein